MNDPRPPKSPRKGKYVNIRIAFLNDTVHVFQVPIKGGGLLLWEAVVNHLQLLEADYFDLEYTNHNGDDCWLDKDKTVLKQIGSPDIPLRFCVKFYTPDPGLLEDELTRYLFALQIRKDLLRGELRCSENTAALLASYIVQGEIGDFDVDEYQDPTYLAVFKFVPEHLQTHEFMAKVMDYHKQHVGESPSEADLNLLDTARKVELYGIKMQPAKDHEGVSLNLAVAHLGVLVFQHFTKINTFSWAKVRKLSFKRKKFLIKLHADTYDRRLEGVTQTPTKSTRGYYKDTVEFFFDTRDRCKLFWKRCIEHHAFFRCQVVAKVPRNKTRVVSRGSSFRYCGRTQKQLVEYVRENIGKRPQFERATSGRISSRSTSVTPKFSSKPSMHSSSADLHTSSGSRSSGSHILDSNHTPGSGVSRDHSGTPHSAMRVESVDVHSDSSMSGSRSLNSPRLEHGLSIDQDVIEAVNARTGGAMTDEEDDEDMGKGDMYSQGREGMTHVASETKGAHSILSPELNSPVRYVGIYSEVDSPYSNRDDGIIPSDMTDSDLIGELEKARAVSPFDFDKPEVIDQLPPSCRSCQIPGVLAGHLNNKSKTDSSFVSVCSAGALTSNDLINHVPRPNLDLKLTDITASLPATSSVVTTTVDHDLPKSNSLPHSQPPLSHKHHSQSPSPDSSPSHTSKPVCTTTPHVCTTTPSQITTTTISMSASQNANDPVREKNLVLKKSMSGNDIFSSNTSVHHPCSHHDNNARLESKKVSETDPGQARVKDLETPSAFASSSSPQFKDSDVKRNLDISPSSCVTDMAHSRHNHKVRLSSRVSSLDSSRTSPNFDVRDKSLPSTPSLSEVQKTDNVTDKTPGVKPEAGIEETKLSKDGTELSSQTKEAEPDRPDHKKIYPNGAVVGAGLPVHDQLEAGQEVSRKLSAGTDLIEDIPYILHRRLDGQKEETAVFKVSEADKIKRQRSVSPGSKGTALSCFQEKQKPGIDQHTVETVKAPEKRCLSPEVTTDARATSTCGGGVLKNRPSLEKSPTVNRRYEFVNVHKLPSRTSYSSVDDTTSPSGDQEILKQLEHGAVGKSAASKSGDTWGYDIAPGTTVSTAQGEDKSETISEGQIKSTVSSEDDKIIQKPPLKENTVTDLLQQKEDHKNDSKQLEVSQTLESHIHSTEKIDTDTEGHVRPLTTDAVDFKEDHLSSPDATNVAKFQNDNAEGITSTPDEYLQTPSDVPVYLSALVISENILKLNLRNMKTPDLSTSQQYFKIPKPQPCHGNDTSSVIVPQSEKDLPKSLPLRSNQTIPADLPLNCFGKPASPTAEDKGYQSADAQMKASEAIANSRPLKQRAPFLSSTGRTSTSSTSSSSENNQFLIDLPSPAAALFYSDTDSPPTSQTEGDTIKPTLTFSTFRPDPLEEGVKTEEPSKLKGCRWSLHSVEEDEETTDFTVIMTEGIVEKSALKKRTFDDSDKPKEPKRVSWHEDSDIQHSYHSDLSMTAQRSPVDENDTHMFGEESTPVDSGSILETLENLRQQNSESDMTNSGSSDSSSVESDMETKNNPKQVYFHYAASKGFSHSTIDSGVGSRSQGHESSPLESLERLESMEGSDSSFGGGKFKMQDDTFKLQQDSSPLEPLEKLRSLRVDNFDDEGEADDEDDEPNFPPPPPILDIPDEMMVSYESDLPLPDFGMAGTDNLQRISSSAMASSAMAYSSDSDNESKAAVCHPGGRRMSTDPLASLDFGDLVGERHCTTSESESDFDAEEANLNLRRMSASGITTLDVACVIASSSQQRPLSEIKRKSSGDKSTVPVMKKIPERPQVLPKPNLQRQSSQGIQEGSHMSQPASQGAPESTHMTQSTHIVQKSKPLPTRSGQAPPPTFPKPQPPPVHPRPGPIRQPQMGKGKHFERTRHKSSSSSSSSSSEPWQHHHQPHQS